MEQSEVSGFLRHSGSPGYILEVLDYTSELPAILMFGVTDLVDGGCDTWGIFELLSSFARSIIFLVRRGGLRSCGDNRSKGRRG